MSKVNKREKDLFLDFKPYVAVTIGRDVKFNTPLLKLLKKSFPKADQRMKLLRKMDSVKIGDFHKVKLFTPEGGYVYIIFLVDRMKSETPSSKDGLGKCLKSFMVRYRDIAITGVTFPTTMFNVRGMSDAKLDKFIASELSEMIVTNEFYVKDEEVSDKKPTKKK